MKQQEIVKKIGVILRELQEQYEFIESIKSPINDLELELFVANGNFLTDHIEILRKVNEQMARAQSVKQTVKKPTVTENFFEPVIQPVRIATPEKKDPAAEYAAFEPDELPVIRHIKPEPVAEDPIIEEPDTTEEPAAEEPFLATEETTYTEPEEELSYPIRYQLTTEETTYTGPEEEATPEYKHDEVADDTFNFDPEEEHFTVPQFTPVDTEPVVNTADTEPYVPYYAMPEPEPQAPSFENTSKPLTLNEILSAQRASVVRQTEQQPRINDLRSAINLNDKMLYVKDLFNGYSLSYSEAIEILNRMDSFDEADRFLRTNYYVKNGWEEKSTTADKFYTLLRRRFA